MKYLIKRVDFNLLVTLDNTKIEHIQDNIYKIVSCFYDSKKHVICYDKQAWSIVCLKYQDFLIGFTSHNPNNDIQKDINLINEWLKYNDFETACKNYLDCNYINFDDVDRIEKINTSIKVHNDKKEQERKQKELERIEQQKAEQQRKIDQVNKDIKENKTVYGSSLQAVIYPAVKDKIKVPLKTLGSLFNIVSVKLDDNFKMEYYRIYKKCKMTDNMVKYFNLIMQEYMQIMEAAA